MRNHFKHSFFIYGFDDEAGSFYAAGYTKNERFEPYSFSFDEFGQALEALSHTDLTFVRLNPAFDFCVDLKGLFYSLYDYTYSQCTLSPQEAGFIYGIDTTRKMAEHICGCIESHGYTDLRYSRFLFEFKAFMNEKCGLENGKNKTNIQAKDRNNKDHIQIFVRNHKSID